MKKRAIRSSKRADEEAFAAVIRNFNRPEHRLLPKHLRLHRAFHDAISRNDLEPESRLPPEVDIARRLGVSLGTAQRALGQLSQDGLVSRRQGHGTFVADRQIPEEELWQFRFMRDRRGAQYLPVFAALRTLRKEPIHGRWSDILGEDPAGYVYVERIIHSDREVRCLSRMYLPASRFGAILDGWLIEMNPLNIKLLLRQTFGAHTTATEQVIRFVTLSAEEALPLQCEPGGMAMQLEATGLDQDHIPISYHEVVMPPSEYLLDITFTGVPGRARSQA